MFLSLRAEVEDALERALAELDFPTDDLGIEEPPDDVASVLASSVAFRLAGEAGAPPPQVAGRIADEIDADELTYVADVQTQGPYLNFLPSDAYLADTLAEATDETYGHLSDREESVVVEHTSANPTGPVHVGRARNPIIGDAVANLLDFAGYDVDRHYYVNDAGRQMAVFTWLTRHSTRPLSRTTPSATASSTISYATTAKATPTSRTRPKRTSRRPRPRSRRSCRGSRPATTRPTNGSARSSTRSSAA